MNGNQFKYPEIEIITAEEKESRQPKQQYISICFCVLLIIIYSVLLGIEQSSSPLMICSISYNIIITIIIFLKTSKIKYAWTFAMILLSKLISLVVLLFLDQENQIIIALLIDSLMQEPTHMNALEQTIIKLCSLVIVCINGNLLSIIVMSSILVLQLLKDLLQKMTQTKKQLNATCVIQNQNNSLYSHIEKQNDEIWKNRMQTIPIIVIIISMQNLQIVHKNQSFYNFFSSFNKTEKELENMVMYHLSFNVSSSNLEEQDVSSINQFINQIRKPHTMTFNQKNQETLQDIPLGYQSLNDIVLNFKSKVQSSFINLHHSGYYEVSCRQKLEDGYYLQLFGQIVQNEKDNELLIFLNDVSGQNEMQQNILINDFKSKILQSFSHELRTPLNGALNFLSSSLQEQKMPQSVKDNQIEPAINSLKIQQYLINDIIDFSSFYQDQIKIKLREFTISELITEISSMFYYQFNTKQLAFHVDLKENQLSSFCTDYKKLLQILVNLIQNSLKYSFKGGCIVRLISLPNQNMVFEIADQGIGIQQDVLYKLQVITKNVDKNKEFVKDWHGIGLLISSIILQYLAPPEMTFFDIKSEGENKGTLISFCIKNFFRVPASQQNIKNSTSNFMNAGSASSQFKLSCSQQLQVNSSLFNVMGTLVKATEFHITSTQIKTQYAQFPSKKSQNDSFYSESNDDYLERRLDDLESLSPFLITDINNVYNKLKDKSSKVINLRQIKQLEERESELFMTGLNSLKKCNCMRILSVDDEIFNQKSLQVLISKMGFEVVLAFNGLQAIQVVQGLQKCCSSCNLLSLILMDYQMPIMNGIEATKQLISMMNKSQIPYIQIVGLTAFTGTKDIDNCLKAGMHEVLAKPLNIQELKHILLCVFKK
ncbi:unnamed protein product (macronuclear) [Paramecium tetraurelia]|uniref:Response regulatory domain-containing protein n=1 Tax=Paramecium tetraurelia TaxID=5888 RepID=A0D8L6_PARTE|nr:uncharacterized protein GSPATT00014329001 [Paramecium tetraurelia]CAK79383.1 unnamed protein product [Paramecium tetraurelia]|eukprot:XP_001446780.1 hypothetical protein (macronuclear) [Paramecium tetraurelia strain d4-2]